jgi:starch synthase (maltosyl-transferring)
MSLPSTSSSVVIENVRPELDCGAFPVKRIVGEKFEISADIFTTSNDVIRASIKYRLAAEGASSSTPWSEVPMSFFENDRWTGSFVLEKIGTYEYTIEAWIDRISSLTRRIQSWARADEDVTADVEDLKKTLDSIILKARRDSEREHFALWEKHITSSGKDVDKILQVLTNSEFLSLVEKYSKSSMGKYKNLEVIVDVRSAGFAAWYEMFHRSQGKIEGKSGTFVDCKRRLSDIKDMGFDTIYLPPIHPIGRTNRRGKNNAGPANPGEPGSPWAIGNENGGHTSINPDLGTMDDFVDFVNSAKELDMQVAIDLAIQCSPDHPYVKEHPEWFYHRADGTIRYAENPPKKYYDVYPLNFESENAKDLWHEFYNVVLFWIKKGIKIFRVDNPHTKPLVFWSWLIHEVKRVHPEVIFLSEAFTRPKPMRQLAKIGFTQSYTYFTWKNLKWELNDWLNEFFLSDVTEYYCGNLFTNTPDILTEYLQKGGRPAFKIRLVLAAMLSPLYGIYNGFELCENKAKPGSEEYLDSEKYQYKVWDWNRPGNIKDFIKKINFIRKENPSLQHSRNLHLLRSDNDNIFFFGRWDRSISNVILVIVNLDPFSTHDSMVYVPNQELGINPLVNFRVRDLITNSVYWWKGEANYVKLDPFLEPAHILLLER